MGTSGKFFRRNPMINKNEKPCIICVAITGSVPRKENNPNLPITISEQVESAQESFELGASIVHCHVRNDDETTTSSPERFALLLENLRKFCPGMIIQFSTGGRSGIGKERGGMLRLGPDMASLTVGSNNFPNRVYENPPDLIHWLANEMVKYNIKPEIEVFDLSHIHQASNLFKNQEILKTPYVQFVMGVKNAMPADKDVFDYYVRTVNRLLPQSEWCAAGIGANQIIVNEWCVSQGGHTRTGLEDNIKLDRNTLAPSNASLVKRVVEICEKSKEENPQLNSKLILDYEDFLNKLANTEVGNNKHINT